jgi:hypothetical protein
VWAGGLVEPSSSSGETRLRWAKPSRERMSITAAPNDDPTHRKPTSVSVGSSTGDRYVWPGVVEAVGAGRRTAFVHRNVRSWVELPGSPDVAATRKGGRDRFPARIAAWVRSRSPSLASIRETWLFTVPSPTESLAAISELDRPTPTYWSWALRTATALCNRLVFVARHCPTSPPPRARGSILRSVVRGARGTGSACRRPPHWPWRTQNSQRGEAERPSRRAWPRGAPAPGSTV